MDDTVMRENASSAMDRSLPDRTKSERGPPGPRPRTKPAKPKGPAKANVPTRSKSEPVVHDPDAMFKEGFLADVYQEKPVGGPNGIKKVMTRFPPEPNGHLHIGHAKAIAINFGFARYHGGECNLRFDDTNPDTAEESFYQSIEDMVRWLGFTPARITHSSEQFDRLYELAERLIEEDGAYVCHCSKTDIEASRGGRLGKARYACIHRHRPIHESLTEFRAMRDGKYQPQEASLRMKQNLDDPNPQMWDLTAYRVRNKPHQRTADRWKIYPTYDFTHCLCDSFEGITHSLCTTEFELSRVSYEWLCDKVKVYKPMQREYGRLTLSGVVTSKRKINELVRENHVRGSDDPRLYTLTGLRRRGVPPTAILAFIDELGVTKSAAEIDVRRFEQTVRSFLETTVPRLMLIVDPVLVVIDDLPDDHLEMLDVPFSKDPVFGTHTVPFTKFTYIERSDFRETDSKDYFRLAPGKSVGLLKVPYPITATSFETDPATGAVNKIHATYEKPEGDVSFKKPKTYIHWVSKSPTHGSPIPVEVRNFNPLFSSEGPDAQPAINPNSEDVFPNAMIEVGFRTIQRTAPWPIDATKEERKGEEVSRPIDESSKDGRSSLPRPETVRFQGMRVAYFCVDGDSTEDKVVLNRIVGLKEDARKEA